MSIQSDLFALLGPLVSNRVYPQGTAPAYTAAYITYSRIDTIAESTLDKNGGTGNLRNSRLQIDVYSLSFGDAQAKAALVRAALEGWAISYLPITEEDMYEPDTKLHRVLMQYSTWHY